MLLFLDGKGIFLMDKIIKFNFDSQPMQLSRKIVMYICPKCKYKIEVPIEAAKEWEEEDILEQDKDEKHLYSFNIKKFTR